MNHLADSRQVIEQAARTSYGRVVAFLSRRTRDIATAEDITADAFAAALSSWTVTGVPPQPEAWLLTSARNRLADTMRHANVVAKHSTKLSHHAARQVRDLLLDVDDIPDERLHMLFACAHPAIDPAIRTAVMLQAVLGLDAAAIGAAFVLSPSAISQRIFRAKLKIRNAGISFELPSREHLPERLEGVLEAIYAAFGTGWEDVSGADTYRRGLADEAMCLARTVVEFLPNEPEALGLLALLLYCEARKQARRGAGNVFVPIQDQPPERWSRPLLAEAERTLAQAAALGTPGRFQLEAAIQSAHIHGAIAGRTDWPAIVNLYAALMRIAPTIGAAVGHAAAIAEASGPQAGAQAGLEALDRIDSELIAKYQPAWALRAHLLAGLGHASDAARAYDLAIGLCGDPAVRTFLLAKRASLNL